MPYTLPVTADTDFAALEQRVAALEQGGSAAPPSSGGGSTWGQTAYIWVDDYPGSDDDKFDAAWATQQADTIKRTLCLDPSRVWHLNRHGRVLTNGFKLRHPADVMGEHKRGSNTTSSDIRTSLTGPAFIAPNTEIFDVEICGLSFQSDIPVAEFIQGQTSGGALWTTTMTNLGFNGYRHVLGSPDRRLAIDGSTLDQWNCNNGDGTMATIAGSDNRNLWNTKLLLDTPPALQGNFVGKYHLILDYMAKSSFGLGAYITGEGPVSSLLVRGNHTSHDELVIHGGIYEGHLEGRPANDANIRIESGGVTLRDCAINFGGLDGYLDVAGGYVLVDGVNTRLGHNATADTPFINHTGGALRVRNVRCSAGHLPIVVTSSPDTLDADDSVRVQPA